MIRNWTPFVPLQAEAAECGIICVAAIAAMHGLPICPNAIKERYGVSTRGVSVSQLLRILREAGFTAHAALVDFTMAAALHIPCIAIKDERHFIVVGRKSGNYRQIFDPEAGWTFVEDTELLKSLSGPVLEIAAVPESSSIALRTRLKLLPWIRQFSSTNKIKLSFVTSLCAQLCVLTVPLAAKNILDNNDKIADPVPIVFAVSIYALIACAGIVVSSIARRIAARMSASLGTQLFHDVSRRVLEKPISYLSRFSPVALTSKITTVRLIQEFVRRISSTTLVLVSMSIVTLGVVAAIEWRMAILLILSILIGSVVDVLSNRRVGAASERLHRASFIQQGGLNDMTRAASAIKAYRAQNHVLSKRHAEASVLETCVINLDDARRLRDDLRNAISVIDYSSFLGLSVWLMSTGGMSFGTFIAISLYRGIAEVGFAELRDALSDLAVLRIATGRLEDVVTTNSATAQGIYDVVSADQSGVIIKNLSFRYSEFDPYVFEGLNLEIKPKECIAIVGPSGTGKSTLAKLLVGSLVPTAGEIYFGPTKLDQSTSDQLLSNIGVVMQNDYILNGSIRDNIDFYRGYSDDDLSAAAKFAEIDSMINELPMRYLTPISDDIAGFSGGQRQRILFARAIAGKPKIMIMDEATSFLDVETERKIAAKIQELGITRIIFAHREETIRAADKIVDLRSLVAL